MIKKVLLIVDDDHVIRDVIKGAFSDMYRILEASTHLDIMQFPSQSVNLAIIDYLLPDRDGFEVLESLREKNPAILSILMTGHGNEDIIIRALRKNVCDYMKKPLDLAYLRKRVLYMLRDPEDRRDDIVPSDRVSQLDNVAKHIQDNFMGDLTLDKLARLACMSRFSFCRAFKERFNQCCISYVNDIRIKNAVKLLNNSHANITEIAFTVGYRNSGHFNRVFKAVYKMSPREYRNRTYMSEPKPS